MDIEDFCVRIHALPLTQPQLGISVLWFLDQETPGVRCTSGEVSRILKDNGVANPHSTKLGEAMLKSKLVQKSGAKHIKLKPTARSEVRSWLEDVIGNDTPQVDHQNGYLPEEVWRGTRGYIETIAEQINGCYQAEYYDAAAVMSRRLIETLLIECYETLKIASRIQDADGNYKMLGPIIQDAINGGLNLGRDPKNDLPKIKTLGDRSAHNRRFIAKKADLDKIESQLRLAVEELVVIAKLQ